MKAVEQTTRKSHENQEVNHGLDQCRSEVKRQDVRSIRRRLIDTDM